MCKVTIFALYDKINVCGLTKFQFNVVVPFCVDCLISRYGATPGNVNTMCLCLQDEPMAAKVTAYNIVYGICDLLVWTIIMQI